MKRYVHLSGALCCCLFVFTTHFSSFAQPGSLDPLFGYNGSGKRFIVDFNLFYLANKTLEMPDGKILISGIGASGNDKRFPFVARLFPNGDTDVDFADSGFIRNDVPISADINCWSLIRQPDGKIVQSGRYYNAQTGRYDLYIMRYLENGILDETFGDNNNGMVFKTIPGFSIKYTSDLILQPDGKIVAPGSKVVASTNGTSTLMYFRYLSDGTPDPEFGTNGLAEIDLGYYKQNTAYLQLLPDGKILGAGNIISDQNEYQNLIIRLNADGTLDDTFGDGGNTIFSYGSINQSVADLKVTADGRILVAGYVENINGNTGENFAIARFNSDGSLDESFGDNGYRFLDGGANSDLGTSIDIQPDGKILFVGTSYNHMSASSLLIFRLNEDGTTDSDFGVNGAVVIGDEVFIPSIAIQSNGTALISGQGETHVPTDKAAFYIARMLLDLNVGTLESNTTNSGLMFYPNPINDHALLGYELLKDQYVEATIYTSDGTLVGTCLPKSRQTAGKHKEQLHIAPNLSAGNYILKITTDDVVKTVRFIKI